MHSLAFARKFYLKSEPSLYLRSVHLFSHVLPSTPSSSPQREGQPPLLLLHGLLANHRNLLTPAKRLQSLGLFGEVRLVDARGHGKTNSPGLPTTTTTTTTLEDCAKDLVDTMKSEGWGEGGVVVGHSFGGKTALVFLKTLLALSLPPPRHIFCLDSMPGPIDRSMSSDGVRDVLDALADVPRPIRDKKEVRRFLVEQVRHHYPITFTITFTNTD